MRLLGFLAPIALTACFLPSEPDLGGMPIHSVEFFGKITLTAKAVLRNDSVIVSTVVTNSGATPGGIEYGPCSFAVRGASRERSWDNRLTAETSCPDVGLILSVAPGEIKERLAFARPAKDLGQPAGPREYTITVYFRNRADNILYDMPAGALVF